MPVQINAMLLTLSATTSTVVADATCGRHDGRTRAHAHCREEYICPGEIQDRLQERATQPRTEEGRSRDQGFPAGRCSERHPRCVLATNSGLQKHTNPFLLQPLD
jgi:hypothetical protein